MKEVIESTTESETETIPEAVDENKGEKVLESVEQEVKEIRNRYNSVQKEKESLKKVNVNSEVSIYYRADRVALIEILRGYNSINYSRIYYFDENGKLYFAFVFDRKKENRLYVKGDIIIRYINENKEVFDLGNEINCNGLDELALSESYEILNRISQE